MHVEVEAEAGLGNQGERPGDLRSGVRSLNLLDTPSLPSGQGAWTSVRSPCSATGSFSSTDIAQRILSRPPGAWLLRASVANPACSYAHKKCVQQGLQCVHLSLGCYSGKDDRGGIKVERAVESQGKDG